MALAVDRKTLQARALQRAWAWDTASDVRPGQGKNVYLVPSRSAPGIRHSVVANASGRLFCSCPAGSMGAPCTHAAGVYLYLLARRGVSVVGVRPG